MVINLEDPYNNLAHYKDSENFVAIDIKIEKRITSLSAGLVEIKQGNTAQFIYQSVQNFLSQRGLQILNSTSPNNIYSQAYSHLLRVCFYYLSISDIIRHSNFITIYLYKEYKIAPLTEMFLLLRYTTQYWIWHTKIIERGRLSSINYSEIFRISSHRAIRF